MSLGDLKRPLWVHSLSDFRAAIHSVANLDFNTMLRSEDIGGKS